MSDGETTEIDLQKFMDDAGGGVCITIIRPHNALAILIDNFLLTVAGKILDSPRMPCMLCNRITPATPLAIGALWPRRDDPSSILGFSFCSKHTQWGDEELMQAVSEKFGGEIKDLSLLSKAGHA